MTLMKTTQMLTLAIYRGGCGVGASLSVEYAITELPGVLFAYVNPATEMAYVKCDFGRAALRQIMDAVERTEYRAGETTIR